jgi:hypothetical protein
MIEDFAPNEVKWCKTCASHKDGLCDECKIPLTVKTGKSKSNSHHFHPGTIAGIPGTIAIYQALCDKCYWKDFSEVYPNEPLPV